MSKVTQKGQVTIPQEIRTLLKINVGDEIIFKKEGKNVILLKKTPPSIKNIKSYIGYLSHLRDRDPDELVNELRGK